MIVTAFNPETDDLEKTYVSTYTAKGSTALLVKNNDRFTTARRALVGKMGGERSEIVNITGVAGDKLSLTVSALVFDHNADDPVYLLEFDQIRFYRATSLTGSYSLMQTMDIDVDNIDGETKWDDLTSLPSHYYKVAFYNSNQAIEGPTSDPIKASGYDINTAGKTIDIHVHRVRDTGFNILTADDYLNIMTEVGNELITQSHRPYDYLRKRVPLNTIAGQGWIDLPTNTWKYDELYLLIKAPGSNRYIEQRPMALDDFLDRYDNDSLPQADGIRAFAIDAENKRILIYPTPKTNQTASVKLRYYKTFDPFTSMAQVIETPNNQIYLLKLRAEYYRARAETDNQWLNLAKVYEDKYGNEIMKMQRANRLDAGTPRSLAGRLRRRRRYHL